MTRKRNLIIVFCVLLILIGIIVAEKLITKHVDKINTVDEIVFTCDPDTLTGLSWRNGEETLTFTKEEDTWKESTDADFPINPDLIGNVLDSLKEIHASFIIDDVEDLSQYGLDEPTATIRLEDSDGEVQTVTLGGFSTMDDKRYISTGDGKVYLIDVDLIDLLSTDLDDFMQQDAFPYYDQMKEMTKDGTASLNVVYDPDGDYTYSESYEYYQVSNGKHLALDSYNVEDYLYLLEYLDLDDYASYKASSEDLSVYGLDNPTTLWVKGQVLGSDGDEAEEVEFTIHLAYVESDETDETTGEPVLKGYLQFDDSEIIYNIDGDTCKELVETSYDDLRPAEIFALDWDTITGVSVTYDGTVYEIERIDAKDYVPEETEETDTEEETEEESPYVYLMNGKKVDIENLKSAIDALEVHTFTSDKPSKQEELSITIRLDNEQYPTLTTTLYQYDGNDCLATDGKNTIGFSARSQMVDVREAVVSLALGQKS